MGVTAVIAATHWAVRSRYLRSQGWWPRFVRSWSDPLLRPVERRVLRSGGNPQDAPLWLAGATLLLGLGLVLLVRWLVGTGTLLTSMRGASPTDWLRLAIAAATAALMAAILVRVIGSWLGVGRYTKWMRPFYTLTDWLINPIQRRLPAMGAIDLSPVLAYLVVLMIRHLLLGILLRP